MNDVVKSGDRIDPVDRRDPAAGGSYAVAWLDVRVEQRDARMLGGTAGFLFNNVNGQSTEFQASRAEGRTRANPAVVAGGSGPVRRHRMGRQDARPAPASSRAASRSRPSRA